jgi:hypothetical protein
VAPMWLGFQACTVTLGLFCWDGFSLTFCPDWPQTVILQICTFQVAGITDMPGRPHVSL